MNFWVGFENRIYAWLAQNLPDSVGARIAAAVKVLSTLLGLVVAPLFILLAAVHGAVANAWPAALDVFYASWDNFRMAWDAAVHGGKRK